jgi:hypothetical protein
MMIWWYESDDRLNDQNLEIAHQRRDLERNAEEEGNGKISIGD